MRRSVNRLPSWVLSAILLGLAGCAAPQMQRSVRFVPPADAAGRACVAGCEAVRADCQSRCQSAYALCAKTLDSDVEAHYADALRQYQADLRRYAAELQRYRLDMHLGWLHAWPIRHPAPHLYHGFDFWPYPPLPPPREPVAPTREAIRDKLEKTLCQADCGCLPAYDACFVGCGGERLTETRCVKNCSPARQ
ncbi:MAG: hypothetical protein LDL16_06355 [Thiobacillus sp.]|nr:hypothetical protein [Thiobacillus sp.]